VRGVDNYLPVSPLAVCECRAGIWVEEKGDRLEVYLALGDAQYIYKLIMEDYKGRPWSAFI
jgi:hypothetical protein